MKKLFLVLLLASPSFASGPKYRFAVNHLNDELINVYKDIKSIPKAALTVNVLDYGAKGDGITDDSASFQAAVNASSSVYIPCNNYVIGSQILISNRTQFSMIGSGSCSTLKQKASTAISVIYISTSTDLLLSNFQIDGNSANQANAGTSHGILAYGANQRVVFDNLTIHDTDGNALEMTNSFDPSTAFDNMIKNCHIYENATNSAGFKIMNPQQSMTITGNSCYTSGNGECAQIEVSSSVISNNIFFSSASIALTLNGGQAYGESGTNVLSNNQFYGADIALELGNVSGLTIVSGNHIEQQWHGAASAAVAFTGTGVLSSSNVVFTGNIIVASRTIVNFGSNPVQTTWNGNIFRRNNPNNGANWFTGTPSQTTFIGNFFDGENMTGAYNIWNVQMSNDAFMGNVFNCGVGTTSNAFQPTSLGSSLSSTFMGNQFLNCTNNFLNGGFDYQIGDEVRSAVTAVNCPNNVWGDATSITLTAGTWLITGVTVFGINGATTTDEISGISTASGNTSSGLVFGDNWIHSAPPTANYDTTNSIPAWRLAVPAGGVTVYLKAQCATSAGTVKIDGARLSAVRIQ